MASPLPNMTDVAQRAGVSHQTVSRVLNGHPNVAEPTRQRVLAAISALGYRPNPTARALVTQRTQTIGVVARDTTLFGPASTLLAIELAARSAGYRVSIASARLRERESVEEAVEELLAGAVDGLLVVAVGDALPAAEALIGRTPLSWSAPSSPRCHRCGWTRRRADAWRPTTCWVSAIAPCTW